MTSRKLTRRKLLGAATVAAAAGAVVATRWWRAGSATPPPARGPYADVRVALVGVGGRGGENLAAFGRVGRVVALCDVDAETLGAAAARHPGAATFADYRRMMNSAAAFDAVAVSTPDHMHAHVAMAAIRAGKHVYVEKPLAHNLAEVRMIVDAARAAGVATQLGIQGHSADATREAVEWVRAGAVGAVREIHCWTDRPTWPQGLATPEKSADPPKTLDWDLWLGCAAPRPYHVVPDRDGRPLSVYHPFRWRGWWAFGTGALGDMGCHLMDVPYWACDLGGPAGVEAEQSGDTPESAPTGSVVRYAFGANARRGAIGLTWYDGGRTLRRPAGVPAEVSWPANGVLIEGEAGTMLVPYRGRPRMIDGEFATPRQTLPRVAGGVDAHHADFLDACVARRGAGAGFDYGGPLTEMALLGNVAIRAGRRVRWDGTRVVGEGEQFVSRQYRAGWDL